MTYLLKRLFFLVLMPLVVSGCVFAQDSAPSTERAGSESSIMGFILVVAWILTIAAVVVWYKRSGIKLFANDEFAPPPYQEGSPRLQPTLPRRRVAARAKPAVNELKQRDSVLSRLDDIVEKTKDDLRPSPIFEFDSIPTPSGCEPLPEVSDLDMEAAILDSCDEFQSNSELRKEALELLGRFRTGRAVEAISQAAMYDILPSVRSTALLLLADVHHPSVLEPLVVASADPAREVVAAASRALSKVNFSRAEEWFRIAASEDIFRIRQCCRALASATIVNMFPRLVNRNQDSVMEAFAITCALIRAGETVEIMDAIMNGSDLRIAKALLHIIDLTNDSQVVRELALAMETFEIEQELREKAETIIAKHTDPSLANLVNTYHHSDPNIKEVVQLDVVA